MIDLVAKHQINGDLATSAGAHRIFDLGIGDPQDDPPQLFYDSMDQLIHDPRVSHYPDPFGESELLTSISNHYLKYYDLRFDPTSEICVTHGARPALYIALHVLDRDGDPCGFVSPAYFGIPTAILTAGMIPFPINNEDLVGSIERLNETFSKLENGAFILNNPHNPLGVILSDEKLEEISIIAKLYNVAVLSDFVYRDLYTTEPPRSFLGFNRESIEVCSFSKSFRVCGIRCGFVVGKGEWIERFRRMTHLTDNGVPSLFQLAMSNLLDEMADVESFRKSIIERRVILINALERIGFQVAHLDNAGTNFVWAKIPDSFGSSTEVASYLANIGVKVLSGDSLGVNGNRHVRFSLNYPPDILQLAANEIVNAFAVKLVVNN